MSILIQYRLALSLEDQESYLSKQYFPFSLLNKKLSLVFLVLRQGPPIKMKQQNLLYVGRRAAASPATGVFDRHLTNQKNILQLAIEADKKEILEMWSGVSLVKYQLPIE